MTYFIQAALIRWNRRFDPVEDNENDAKNGDDVDYSGAKAHWILTCMSAGATGSMTAKIAKFFDKYPFPNSSSIPRHANSMQLYIFIFFFYTR